MHTHMRAHAQTHAHTHTHTHAHNLVLQRKEHTAIVYLISKSIVMRPDVYLHSVVIHVGLQ